MKRNMPARLQPVHKLQKKREKVTPNYLIPKHVLLLFSILAMQSDPVTSRSQGDTLDHWAAQWNETTGFQVWTLKFRSAAGKKFTSKTRDGLNPPSISAFSLEGSLSADYFLWGLCVSFVFFFFQSVQHGGEQRSSSAFPCGAACTALALRVMEHSNVLRLSRQEVVFFPIFINSSAVAAAHRSFKWCAAAVMRVCNTTAQRGRWFFFFWWLWSVGGVVA